MPAMTIILTLFFAACFRVIDWMIVNWKFTLWMLAVLMPITFIIDQFRPKPIQARSTNVVADLSIIQIHGASFFTEDHSAAPLKITVNNRSHDYLNPALACVVKLPDDHSILVTYTVDDNIEPGITDVTLQADDGLRQLETSAFITGCAFGDTSYLARQNAAYKFNTD